jgi:glutamyl-tRNA reductase
MSTPAVVRKKIAILGKPYVKEVIYDMLNYYINEIEGMAPSAFLVEEVEQVVKEIENQYKQQLPKKQPKVVNRDLEDLISEMSEEKLQKVHKLLSKPDTSKDAEVVENMIKFIEDTEMDY